MVNFPEFGLWRMLSKRHKILIIRGVGGDITSGALLKKKRSGLADCKRDAGGGLWFSGRIGVCGG